MIGQVTDVVDPGAKLTEIFVVVVGVIVGLGALAVAAALLSSKLTSTWLGRLWRRLWTANVTDPLTRWQRSVVQDRIEWLMTHENGGSSLKDLSNTLRRLELRFDEHLTESTTDRAELHRQLGLLLDHDADRDQPGKRYGGTAAEGGE